MKYKMLYQTASENQKLTHQIGGRNTKQIKKEQIKQKELLILSSRPPGNMPVGVHSSI